MIRRHLLFCVACIALLLAPSIAGAACTSPAGAEGENLYNADYHVMQFCNGTTWIAMASASVGAIDSRIGTLTASKWCKANAGATAIDCITGDPGTSFGAGTAGAPGWAVTTDTDTGLYEATANTLSISSGGVEVARFGYVASAVNYFNFAPGAAGSPATVTMSAAGSSTDVNIAITPKGAGYTLLSGNVGIGTASPAATARLTIDSATDNGTTANLKLRSLTTRYRSDIYMIGASGLFANAYDDTGGVYLPIGVTGSQFQVNVGTAGGTTALFANSSGNVGIGTTNPGTKLTVWKAAGASAANEILVSDGTQWMTTNTNSTGGSYSSLVQAGDHAIIYSNGSVDTGALTIGQWSGSLRGIRIDSSGNVGIGTTTANGKLTFSTANVYTAPLGSSYGQYDIIFYDGGTAAGSYGMGIEGWNIGLNSAGGYKFYQAGGSTPLMVIGGQSSTNVGIGTASPNASGKLHISGGDNSFAYFGPNSTWGGYLWVGSGYGRPGSSIASIASTNGNLHLDAATGTDMFLNYYSSGRPIHAYGAFDASGIISTAADMRAPIFYDSNNTGYYVDPASTSNLNAATFANNITIGSSTHATNGDVYMPWAGTWLSTALSGKAPSCNNWAGSSYYLGCDGNLYMSWLGDWLSNRIGQDVRTNAGVRFSRVTDDDGSHFIDSNVQSYMSSINVDDSYYTTSGAKFQYNGDIWMPWAGTWLSQYIMNRVDSYGHVNGLDFWNGGYIQMNSCCWGAFGINVWQSDERLKEKIADSKVVALDELKKMRFIEFNWKKGMGDPHRRTKLGFSAQNLQSIEPQWIYEVPQEDKTTRLMPDQSTIIPAIAKAVVELAGKVDDGLAKSASYDDTIKGLKTQIDMMKHENELLKSAVCRLDASATLCGRQPATVPGS